MEKLNELNGSVAAFPIVESRSAKHLRGLLSWVGAGRARFLFAHLRFRGGGARFWKNRPGGGLRQHAHADDATDRRAPVRNARRSLRPARAADDRHRFLFSDRIAHRVRAELHRVLDPARALRNWDGRRVGTGRIAGDGDVAGESARPFLRHFAAGLRFWLSAGSDRLLRLSFRISDGAAFLSRAPCRRCW